MITRLGAAILLGSLVTVGSACAEPALDPDRFLDFGADPSPALAATEPALDPDRFLDFGADASPALAATEPALDPDRFLDFGADASALAAAEPAPTAETAASDADLAALAPDNFLDPQADVTAALIAASLSSAGARQNPAAPAVAEETTSEEPADFALILPEPPPVGLALILPDAPVDLASTEPTPIDLSDFEQAVVAETVAPVDAPVDVAEALAPEHFLDPREDETLAWIANDLAGPEVVETGSIGDGPGLMPVTGEHAEFTLDLEPLAP